MNIFNLFEFTAKLEVMDVGAAAITEVPIYKKLMDLQLAHLTAFEGDARHAQKIKDIYGDKNASVHSEFLFDGKWHPVYLCSPNSGMTSLYKPKSDALAFFNGFSNFGKIQGTEEVQTTRLDDIEGLQPVDFLKMDVQGAELEVIENGPKRLENCLAMQLEVSYFPLYENQPSFGDVDVYMRKAGYVPHRFLDVKRWSIAPTIFNGNFRVPGNQLLESDIVYVRNPLLVGELSDLQLQKLAVLAHYAFQSVDYCGYLLLEMERRGLIAPDGYKTYIENLADFA